MENKSNENEKIIKNKIINNNKKDIVVKKRLNLISLDKFHNKKQQSKKIIKKETNKNDENLVNIKNNEKEQNNIKYEPIKIRLKLPEEVTGKRKMIDYIVLNKKSYNNLSTQNEPSSIKNLYKENFENKKKLEELINDFSLKKKRKKNDLVQGNNSTTLNQNINENKNNNINLNNNDIVLNNLEENSIKKEINKKIKEINDKKLTLTLNNNNNYCKKRPFYALDCNIYCKFNNIEKKIFFKKNKLKNGSSFSKKSKISNNYLNIEKIKEDIKKRNNLKTNPNNLTYNNDNNTTKETDNNIYFNYNNNFSKMGRNLKLNNIKKNIMNCEEENKISTVRNTKNNNNVKIINVIADKKSNSNIENENHIYKKINILNNKNNQNGENFDIKSRNSKNSKTRKHHSFNRRSFKFLIHQTNKSRELSLSFNKRYRQKKPVINSNEILINDSLSYSNIYNFETDTHLDQESNKTTSILNYNNIYNDKRYHFGKEKTNFNSENLLLMKRSIDDELIKNKNNFFDKDNYSENKKYYKKIINDNYIEYTPVSGLNTNENSLNNKTENREKLYKKFNILNKKSSCVMPKNRPKHVLNTPKNELYPRVDSSLSSLDINNNYYSVNNLDKDNKAITPIILTSINTNIYAFSNLELLYFIEEKIKIIIDKIKEDEKCSKECQQFINYYFEHNFYIEELRVFKLNKNRDFMINYIKMELLCYYLLYNISLGEKFSETKILLKSIVDLLYNNFLLFISSIISLNENRDNIIIIVLNKIFNDNLNDLVIKSDNNNVDENNYINNIINNSKCINDYYKMIINNIYYNHIKEINNIKFPESIK